MIKQIMAIDLMRNMPLHLILFLIVLTSNLMSESDRKNDELAYFLSKIKLTKKIAFCDGNTSYDKEQNGATMFFKYRKLEISDPLTIKKLIDYLSHAEIYSQNGGQLPSYDRLTYLNFLDSSNIPTASIGILCAESVMIISTNFYKNEKIEPRLNKDWYASHLLIRSKPFVSYIYDFLKRNYDKRTIELKEIFTAYGYDFDKLLLDGNVDSIFVRFDNTSYVYFVKNIDLLEHYDPKNNTEYPTQNNYQETYSVETCGKPISDPKIISEMVLYLRQDNAIKYREIFFDPRMYTLLLLNKCGHPLLIMHIASDGYVSIHSLKNVNASNNRYCVKMLCGVSFQIKPEAFINYFYKYIKPHYPKIIGDILRKKIIGDILRNGIIGDILRKKLIE